MKKTVAFISAAFMFVVTWSFFTISIALLWPYSYKQIVDGIWVSNIASLIGSTFASLAAIHSFKASKHAKTGKLYIEKHVLTKTVSRSEKQILKLVDKIPDLPVKDYVIDFATHDEYERAIEQLCYEIENSKTTISRDVFEKIVELAESMKMEDSIWKPIEIFVG